MRTIAKYALTLAMTGAMALAVVSPSDARNGRNAAAAIGFGAGALVGAAVAGSYYGGPGYYDGYAYAPDYAYEPAPVYVAPAPVYRSGRCWVWTDSARGYGYYGPC